MEFNQVEGNIILNALDEYDEYFLPRSISRTVLYLLIRKFIDKLGIKIVDGGYDLPHLLHDKFNASKSFEIDLNIDELDYINRAMEAENSGDAYEGYPKYIQEAASGIYHRTYEALKAAPVVTPENQMLFQEIFK